MNIKKRQRELARLLTADHNQDNMICSRRFQLFQQDPQDAWSPSISVDKIWIYYYTRQTRDQFKIKCQGRVSTKNMEDCSLIRWHLFGIVRDFSSSIMCGKTVTGADNASLLNGLITALYYKDTSTIGHLALK